MIEQALRFGAILRLSAYAQSLRDCLVDQLLFRSLGVNHFERLTRNAAIDFFELQIALESPAANRFLLHLVRRVTKSEALVIQVTILAQPGDHNFDYFRISSAPPQQTFTQLGDGARFCSQEFYGTLESFTEKLRHG